MNADYSYIANSVAEICGQPVRVYKNGIMIYSQYGTGLSRDPMRTHEQMILSVSSRIAAYVTPDLYMYGIVNSESLTFIIGPSRESTESDIAIRASAERLGIDERDIPAYTARIKQLSDIPADKFLRFLCLINYFLNNEKLDPDDIIAYDPSVVIPARIQNNDNDDDSEGRQRFADIYSLEQKIVSTVRKGDADSLEDLRFALTSVGDDISRAKRYFVIISSVAVRAAIKGGMDTYGAFVWNRKFNDRCDELADLAQIGALRFRMIQFYTEEVRKLRMGNTPSKLVMDIAGYIREHISEPIRTSEIAEAFYLSRSHLSREFRLESGMTLSDFIMLEKTEEAKRLLRYTEKPVSDISSDLGFSSQSHLIKVFRKYEGLTPGEYRKKYVY